MDRPELAVNPGDLLQALTWVADAVHVSGDVDEAGAHLGADPLPVWTQLGMAALERCAAGLGLAVRPVEVRLRDLGRDRPFIGFAAGYRPTAAVLHVHGLRRGRHQVRIVDRGQVTRRSMSSRALARFLGVPSVASIVRGLAPSPALPLAAAAGPTLTPYRRARALLAIDREDLWLCAVYGVAIGVLSLATPIAVQAVVNTVSFGSVLQPLLVLTVLLAIGLGFAGMLRVLQAYVVETLQARMFVRAIADVARRLVRAEPSALARYHAAELSHRLFELPTIQKSSALLLVDGIDLLLKLAVGMPLLAFYHPLLLLFALLLVSSLAFVVFVLGRGAVATALGESAAKHDAANWLESLARLPGRFSGKASRRWALERADRLARRYRDARALHFAPLVRHMVGGVGIKLLGAAVLLGIGGGLVIANQLTLGQLVAAELVFTAIGAAVLKLHKQLEAAYDTMASAHKLGLLLDLPLERDGGELVRPLDGPASACLRGAALGDPGRPPLATGIDLAIAAGDRVAVTGPGGTGKSTLLDVLATTRTPAEGTYELDGADVRLVELASVRDDVLVVRDPELVRGSVLDNLRLHRRDLDLHDVEDAVAAVGLADAIRALPDGLATELTPGGRPLSSTELRRLMLARALLARPRLLLIDRALDDLGLPPELHADVIARVLGPAAPWTAVVATDHPAVLAACPRRLQLGQGRVEEVPA